MAAILIAAGAAMLREAAGRNMSNELFAAALGLEKPWYVKDVRFDAGKRLLTVVIDFTKGGRFPYEGTEGRHPVHDTQTKRYRHLNFFQHECYLEVRTPRIKLADGRVVLIEPDWAGKLSGFTLLFEALVLTMCRQMPFAAVARLGWRDLAPGSGHLRSEEPFFAYPRKKVHSRALSTALRGPRRLARLCLQHPINRTLGNPELGASLNFAVVLGHLLFCIIA
jgi:hypothetical protein